jgi:hypothetical protein
MTAFLVTGRHHLSYMPDNWKLTVLKKKKKSKRKTDNCARGMLMADQRRIEEL